MKEKYIELKNNRIPLREMIPLEMPFAMFVDPTNWCNFKCSFCPRNLDDFSKYAGNFKHMSINTFKKIIYDIKEFKGKLKVLRLFYLGEPLLCPDFFKMLELAIDENIADRIEISSNGSLLTREKAQIILDLAKKYQGMIYMRFSIYSVIPEKNRAITKSPIGVEKIYRNIYNITKLKKEQNINNVITYAKMLNSFDDENEKFKKIYKNAVDEVNIEQPMNWSSFDNKNLLDVYNEKDIESITNEQMPKVCAYPFDVMAIQSDGDVVCCCVDWTRHTKIGNIHKKTLKEIWNGEELKKIRILHLEGKRNLNKACNNCLRLPCGNVYDKDNLDGLSPDILNS